MNQLDVYYRALLEYRRLTEANRECSLISSAIADADTEITYHKGIGKQAEKLPDFWPVWCWPECDGIWREMQEDPRFADWLRRTKE